MEVRRTEMEIYKTEKTYYDALNQAKNDSDNFWKIFITICALLISVIVFVTCYRYICGKIICICKRCFTWRNEKHNIDDTFFAIKSERNRCSKQRFLWSNGCNISKSHTKFNGQKDKVYETKSHNIGTPLQETEKLLSFCEDKLITSNSNIDLTKRLFLKLSALSSSINNKGISDGTSNKCTIENFKKYTRNKLYTQRAKNFYQNSQKDKKSTHFSDADLKFLVISSKRSDENKNRYEKILLCKWNSGNINSYNLRNDTSSKLIELQCENKNSFSNNRKYPVFRSKSNCLPGSLLLTSLANNSLSDSAANESNILPNFCACTSFTMSSVSNAVKVKSEENSFTYISPEINKLQKIKSDECNVHSKKLKSSVDILRSQIEDIEIPERKVKSEDNLMIPAIKSENNKNFTFIHKKYTESLSPSPNYSSETNEIYDELGILFSQYMKLQIKSCRRKYCIRSRHLKRTQHSTRKCRTRFNYSHIYSYDQRPMCNCGNICEDTYDELKLMFTVISERKNIYEHMFTRRKKFLNQPCISVNQEFITK